MRFAHTQTPFLPKLLQRADLGAFTLPLAPHTLPSLRAVLRGGSPDPPAQEASCGEEVTSREIDFLLNILKVSLLLVLPNYL